MINEYEKVKDWMIAGGQETPNKPTMPSEKVRVLRIKLIAEELIELASAFGYILELEDDSMGISLPALRINKVKQPQDESTIEPNLVEAYDAVIDLLVVVFGTAVAMGCETDPGFEEVMRANFSKFGPGSSKREDGKILKSPSYRPPELKPIIEAMLKRIE